MPRLTNSQYLDRHSRLHYFWSQLPELFSELSPAQQQVLHHYYGTAEPWDEYLLLSRRRQLDTASPSLGARAGKAYARIDRAYQRLIASPNVLRPEPARPLGSDRHISVRGVLKPTPDIHSLAKVLMDIAADLTSHEDAGEPPDSAAAA